MEKHNVVKHIKLNQQIWAKFVHHWSRENEIKRYQVLEALTMDGLLKSKEYFNL